MTVREFDGACGATLFRDHIVFEAGGEARESGHKLPKAHVTSLQYPSEIDRTPLPARPPRDVPAEVRESHSLEPFSNPGSQWLSTAVVGYKQHTRGSQRRNGGSGICAGRRMHLPFT